MGLLSVYVGLGSYHLDLAAGAAMAGVAVAMFFGVMAFTELRAVARRRPSERRAIAATPGGLIPMSPACAAAGSGRFPRVGGGARR